MSWFDGGDLAELLIFLPYDTYERLDVGTDSLFDEQVEFYEGMMDFFLNGKVDEATKRKWEQFCGMEWGELG
jgi:hypothetical protein